MAGEALRMKQCLLNLNFGDSYQQQCCNAATTPSPEPIHKRSKPTPFDACIPAIKCMTYQGFIF